MNEEDYLRFENTMKKEVEKGGGSICSSTYLDQKMTIEICVGILIGSWEISRDNMVSKAYLLDEVVELEKLLSEIVMLKNYNWVLNVMHKMLAK